MAEINQSLQGYTTHDYSPIPAGEYDFEVSDSDVVTTKSQKMMIKLAFKVTGPAQVGRIVFDNFLIGHEIAMSRLKTLATVSGHPRPDYIRDTQELHGLRFRATVGVKDNPGYAPQNYIKTFKRIPAPNGAPVQPQAPMHAAPPVAAPVAPPPPPPTQQSFQQHAPPPPPPFTPPLAPASAQPPKPPAPWVK